jgi:hypothetical protein
LGSPFIGSGGIVSDGGSSNALALVHDILAVGLEESALGQIRGVDSQINPGSGVPVGPIITFLSAFITIAVSIGFLAGVLSTVSVVDVLVSSEQTLVPLAGNALPVPGFGFVEHVGLHFTGMAIAGGLVEGTLRDREVDVALSIVGGRSTALVSGLSSLTIDGKVESQGASLGASVTEGVVGVVVSVGIKGSNDVVLISTRASEGKTVSEVVVGVIGLGDKGEVTTQLKDVLAGEVFGVGGIRLDLGTVTAVVLRIPFNSDGRTFIKVHGTITIAVAASGIIVGVPSTVFIVTII